MPSFAQDDSKRPAENSATHKRTEMFRSMARDREGIRSEEHVTQKSAHAALMGNIFEGDRAKDVEQFDDVLRTFINKMNNFENRFGKIRDEEKMLAAKKLMPESLLTIGSE